jgi:DNA-binding transcriptional LysR family regulator
MDRLEAMSLVLAVAEAGSLSAAARRQKAPLATVSRKVSELESHLRTKLFNRSNRALVPTDAGRSYIAAAKRILTDVAEAERAAAGEHTTPRGGLTVSASLALRPVASAADRGRVPDEVSGIRRSPQLAGPRRQSS